MSNDNNGNEIPEKIGKPYGIVYKITNSVNGKSYVGRTTNVINQRWSQHKANARKKIDHPLYNDINKQGYSQFEVIILCTCEDQKELSSMEKYYVNFYNTWTPFGYNSVAGNGPGSVSQELKEKLSKNHNPESNKKGKKYTGQALENLRRNMAKAREVRKGKPLSEEQKRKMSIKLRGQKRSEETKLKLSKSKMGDKNPMYGRTKELHHNYGKPMSEESKRKNAIKHYKTYYLISPSGEPVTVIGMKPFCKENNLSYEGLLKELISKKKLEYKGWRLNPNV